MKRRLSVRLVNPAGVLGGAELWLLKLLDATDALDLDAVLLADGVFAEHLRVRGIPTRVRKTGRRASQVLVTAGWLAQDLRQAPVDVVLANGVKAAAAAVPSRWIARTPVVWVKHDHFFDRRLARPLGRRVDRVIATVEEVAVPTGRADAAVILPPRPEREPATRSQAQQRWAQQLHAATGPVAVMVTRLVPYKGVDDAITALARVPEWRLVVIGDDDPSAPGERARLHAIAEDYGVADRIAFAGFVPDAAHWLSAFDVLLVLTKLDDRGYGGEGFGMAALEAMLAGVPVVAVEGGAVVRRLAGRAGYAVPMADPAAVAAALDRLSDVDARHRAGAAARGLVADHPTAEMSAARLVAELTAVCGRTSHR